MRKNYTTVLVGCRCVLVPYRKEHVLKYHEWMKDPAMLEATGSEPLSLDEEYGMQQSWRDDSEKATFIVLSRDAITEDAGMSSVDLFSGSSSSENNNTLLDDDFISKTLSAMAGDVNLFLSDEETSEDGEQQESGEQQQTHRQAELDIMVAEKCFQRKGLGKEASCLMMLYAAKNLSIRRFFCKINEDNLASLSLFRSLGFEQCAYAACFKQYEFELKRNTPEEMVVLLSDLLGHSDLVSFSCSDEKEASSVPQEPPAT